MSFKQLSGNQSRITTRLDPDVWELLKEYCLRENRSSNNAVNRLLKEMLLIMQNGINYQQIIDAHFDNIEKEKGIKR